MNKVLQSSTILNCYEEISGIWDLKGEERMGRPDLQCAKLPATSALVERMELGSWQEVQFLHESVQEGSFYRKKIKTKRSHLFCFLI